jgi:hypothetical protein
MHISGGGISVNTQALCNVLRRGTGRGNDAGRMSMSKHGLDEALRMSRNRTSMELEM